MVRRIRQHWGRWVVPWLLWPSLFLLGDYVFFTRLWGYLAAIPGGMGTILTTQLLNMVFLSFFSMLVFSNTVASLSTIYLSSDLLILMASPARLTNVFITKFYQTLFNSSWMVFLFGFPVFLAFGQSHAAPWTYYAWLMPVLLPFLVIPGGLGILFTMLADALFPGETNPQSPDHSQCLLYGRPDHVHSLSAPGTTGA